MILDQDKQTMETERKGKKKMLTCLMAKFSSAVLTAVRMLSTCRVSVQHFLQLQETLTAQPGFSWRLRFCEIMDVSVM